MTTFPHYCLILYICVWKNEQFTVAQKIFRQIISLVFSLVKTLLSRNFCQRSVTGNFRNFHTVCLWLVYLEIRCFHEIFAKSYKNWFTEFFLVCERDHNSFLWDGVMSWLREIELDLNLWDEVTPVKIKVQFLAVWIKYCK